MRRGWLPDPPKKRRKRKPRKRAHRRRTTSSTKAGDVHTPDEDASKDMSAAAWRSRQAADDGESSKNYTITLAAEGLGSREDASCSPGTSRQANEMETREVAEEIGSVLPKVRRKESVVQEDAKGMEQMRPTGAECSRGKALDGRNVGHHLRVIVKSRPSSGLDDPSLEGGNLPKALPVNTKVLYDSCGNIGPGISGKETVSKGRVTGAGVEVMSMDDFVNYNLGITSSNGVSSTSPSEINHNTGALNTKADGAIEVEYLKNFSAAIPSDDEWNAQFSQILVNSKLYFDSINMNHGEDAADGATSNDLKRILICDAQEHSVKSDGLTTVDAPSTSGKRSCVGDRSEETGDPLRRLSLNESDRTRSIAQGSCEPVSSCLFPQPPNVVGECSSRSQQNANVQPIFALSESHSCYRPISVSLIDPVNNSVLSAPASENRAGLSIANGKIALGAGEVPGLVCGAERTLKIALGAGEVPGQVCGAEKTLKIALGAGEVSGQVCSAERTLKIALDAGEVPGEVCSAGRTLKRTLSTASTVSANNSFHSEHGSDSDSTEDESAHVGNEQLSQAALTSILEHNALMSVKHHVDGIDAPKELPESSPAAGEFECKSLSSDQHNVADLDGFSTHSATDSLQSAIDSGLGSSQDLFQYSPSTSHDIDHNEDDSRHMSKNEPSKTEFRRRNKTSVYSKKISHWKGEKCGRKRSNQNSAVLEIVDVYIENISSESQSSGKLTDRSTKRKYSRDSPCKRSPSVKRARKDNSPLKRYLTEGLLINSDEVDVTSLPLSHSTKIISSAIADFLRSTDAHSWLATDVGRSWVSSASVQAMLLASLTGGGGRSGEVAGEGSSKPVDVRTENLCIMCQDRPKDAAIIHGKTSHQTTCYKCAKMLFARKQRCPVCRRKILRISKNIIV